MNMPSALTLAAPSATVMSTAAVRQLAAPPAAAKQEESGQNASGEDRRQGSETTLRYKFDWLVQRQVSAGTIDAKDAVEMIRLFGKTVDRPLATGESKEGDGKDVAKVDATAPANATGSSAGAAPSPSRGNAAATALVDRLREQFGVTGPYDGSGGKTVSTPVGMIVDDQA